jgi:transcriptional regulator with XRE-family HTH domain
MIQTSPQPDLFGPMLRAWRRRRGASQLALALQSGVSQRHVSFLESGRARPSREMVVQLTSALDVPLRQRNAMLLAAGFAPVYRESNLAAPELAPVRQAIDRILKQQEPYRPSWSTGCGTCSRATTPANAFTAVPVRRARRPRPPPGKGPNLLALAARPQGVATQAGQLGGGRAPSGLHHLLPRSWPMAASPRRWRSSRR